MPVIEWSAFTWEAFATLATGVMAVGAAVWVGRRQLAIWERQNWLAEITLRHDLFERRMEVYDAVRVYLVKIMTEGRISPELGADTPLLQAMSKSTFLFRPEVGGRLNHIWRQSMDLRLVQRRMEISLMSNGDYSAEDIATEDGLLKWVGEQLSELPDIFGPELRLV